MKMMVMDISLSGAFLLLFLFSSPVSGLGSVVSTYYTYVRVYETWANAQSYCRTYHTDLATIYRDSDRGRINIQKYDAWVGLSKVGDSWEWMDGDYFGILQNWGKNEPHNEDECAFTHYEDKRYYGVSCEAHYFFFCQKMKHHGDWDFTFIPETKTWSEARQFCQDQYDDLAKFRWDESDRDDAVVAQNFPSWIGLYRHGQTWNWSRGLSEFTKWDSGEPDDKGDCVTLSSDKKEMATHNCSNRLPVVCITDNIVVVNERKTWEEALDHCRGLSTANRRYDLISVQPGGDYEYVMNKVMEANTDEVWTGLRFLAGSWVWVNGADMLYSDLPVCPSERLRCGVLSKDNTGTMETRDCTERKNFLCYSA